MKWYSYREIKKRILTGVLCEAVTKKKKKKYFRLFIVSMMATLISVGEFGIEPKEQVCFLSEEAGIPLSTLILLLF